MRKPAVIVLIGYIIGIIWGLYLKISIAFFLPLYAILCYYLWKIKWKNKYIRLLKTKMSYTALIVISISALFSNMITVYKQKEYKEVYNKLGEEEFIATVISNKIDKEYKETYIIKIESISGKKENRNIKLYLNRKIMGVKQNQLEYGDLIYFKGIYEMPSTERNDKGFDYQKYLKSVGIYGNVTSKGEIKTLKKKNVPVFSRIINTIGVKIKEKIDKLFPKEISAVITGILLGDTSKIEEEIKDNFKNSNLSHLLAVSGTHVSNIILGITLLEDKIKLHKKLVSCIKIVILFLFIFITGSTPSVIRACFMVILHIVATLIYRKADIVNNMAISCFVLCIINPFYLLNIGLLLSFGGTIGIVLLSRVRKTKKARQEEKVGKRVKDLAIEMSFICLAAQIIIFPIVLINFNTVSLTFLISNLLAGPLLSFILIGGFLSVFLSFLFFPIANIISNMVTLLVNILLIITQFCSKLPFSKIYCITPPSSLIFIYYGSIFYFYYLYQIRKGYLILKWWEKYKRKIAIILVVSIIVTNLISLFPKKLRIDFVDVGQGDCCLLVTPYRKRILLDGGGSENKKGMQVGEDVVLPHLLKHGIARLDYIVISHFDTDHVGSLLTIMKELKVKNVIIGKQFESCENYEEFKKIIQKKKMKVHVAEAGQRIKIEKDLYLDVLWPDSKNIISENSINNNSLLCKMVYQSFSMLFTGDIEQIAEKAILEKYKGTNVLQSIILKVAHHGSKSSSIEEFLNAVKPKIALIGVGENNTFGHPNSGVLERIQKKRL